MASMIVIAVFVLCLGMAFGSPNFIDSQDILKVIRDSQKLGSSLKKPLVQNMEIISDQFIQKGGQTYKEVVDDLTHEVKKISKDFQKVVSGVSFHDNNCECKNYTCGCCYNLVVEQISLNDTGCLNITYLVDEYGFEFTFTLNGKVVIDRKISVKNPPPICADIPYIHNLASLCLRFYNLDYADQHFTGCASLEAELEGVVVKSFELGCFKIPPTIK